MTAALLALALARGALAADPPSTTAPAVDTEAKPAAVDAKPEPPRIRPKHERGEAAGIDSGGGLLQPDVDLIDAPTTAVLDYGGYSARSRFFSNGGLLQYVDFGVFQNLNLGASLSIDRLVGNDRTVRVRAPNAQVKYRFYDGDRTFPSFAVGYDGQGTIYNQPDKRYNQRQRGFYVVGSQELGWPGFQIHPSMNISDFDSNAFFGSVPLSLNIQDKVMLMLEWDNINTVSNSRLNAGVRAYVTAHFHVDFAVRGIGQGGHYSDGASRGPERIVQLKYSGNF